MQYAAALNQVIDFLTLIGIQDCFVLSGGAVAIAVGQTVQLMPALSFSWVQPAGPLLTPGLPVIVFHDHRNANASLLCSDQRLGNPRKTELLNGHQHFLGGAINGSISHASMSSTLCQSPVRGER